MPNIGEIKKDSRCRELVWAACVDCGKERWVQLTEGNPRCLRCISCAQKGSNNNRWKGGRTRDRYGYIKICAPWHPNADHGYVFEHRLVAEESLGRLLNPGEVCHHINGIIDDNRAKNIKVYRNNSGHLKEHRMRG